MKKIIFALLVLSVALIGMSFVSASSDVDGVNVDSASNNVNKHWDFPDPYDPSFIHKIIPNWGLNGPIDPCSPSGANPGPVA
ncbi:hypothetical protein [uncultured Methanobrevibacter sp.]|uniref:hypothetical protein n=1 Tax=uncultured Methanobrevibacter sp. TaxID=253161 RepID=UPI0025F82C71|nr:hypothetical protein [uncultured Methanobrevibacter sp.]